MRQISTHAVRDLKEHRNAYIGVTWIPYRRHHSNLVIQSSLPDILHTQSHAQQFQRIHEDGFVHVFRREVGNGRGKAASGASGRFDLRQFCRVVVRHVDGIGSGNLCKCTVQTHRVVAQRCPRCAHLVFVVVLLVSAKQARIDALPAGLGCNTVIQAPVHNPLFKAAHLHERRTRTPQVMTAPCAPGQDQGARCRFGKPALLLLPLSPALTVADCTLEHVSRHRTGFIPGMRQDKWHVTCYCVQFPQQSQCEARQVNGELLAVLRLLGGMNQVSLAEVHMHPARRTDFIDTRERREHHPHGQDMLARHGRRDPAASWSLMQVPSIADCLEAVAQFDDLAVTEHALAPVLVSRWQQSGNVHFLDGADLEQQPPWPAFGRPREHRPGRDVKGYRR